LPFRTFTDFGSNAYSDFGVEGYEADDVIGTIACKAEKKVTILLW
jgi:hypothetical protein